MAAPALSTSGGRYETVEGSFAFLKSIAEVSTIFVGFTFISGWSYLASYYSCFGLNSLELDLPLPVVCTAAVYVLFNSEWWLPAVVFAILLGWLILAYRRKLPRRSLMAAMMTVLLLITSTVSIHLGRKHANDDMLTDSNELPNVAFSSKLLKTDQPNCVNHEMYGSSDCKLLLHSKGNYYFFEPIPNTTNSSINFGSLNVYTLADSDVTGLHILRGLERNARQK